MATQLQVRNDTAANWTSANPTLLAGEIGFETDTKKFKIGTGATAWSSLPYGSADLPTYLTTYLTSPAAIGGTTPAAGTFTTLTATSLVGIGAGFQNVTVFTTGTSATWSVPAALQVTGAKFKVTVIGGGGQGGGTSTTAGQVGGGGGAGGAAIKYLTYVAGQNSATYTVGAAGSGAIAGASGNAGTASTFIYNSVTYTGGLGNGGTLNAAGGAGGTGTNGDINLTGQSGANGGTMAATSNYQGNGGNAPMGVGFGGQMPVTSNGADGNVGVGYGGGGSGGRNGTGITSRAGGAGTAGIIIIEY